MSRPRRADAGQSEATAGGVRAVLVDVALPVPLPQTFTYRWDGEAGAATPGPGDLVAVPLGRRREVIGLVVATRVPENGTTSVAGHPLRPVARVLPPAYRLERDRWRLAAWLAEYYALPLGEVVPLFHPPAPGTRARARRAAPGRPFPLHDSPDVVLTPAQAESAATAAAWLAGRRFGVLLLHGITGSGKTEVYLRVIAQALALGRGAIFLLPEIALTPQTVARIAARFGERVGTLHSGLPSGERCRVHEAAAAGAIQVVVGPRSALFAPLPDLGVIVVDEEHDHSYKQEEKPRYHARHAALVRAREAGAVVLLGSATPDLETFHNARTGRYRLVTISDRPVGELPRVEIVDMRGEPAPEGFSRRLLAELEAALGRGRQAILYYNRRGYARSLQCADCGAAGICPRCDIGLTFHLRPRRLLCHYCGHAQAAPVLCPTCGGRQFLPAGGGTERLELALAAALPDARVARLDQDATRVRGSHDRILGAFAAGDADILVGTQMVAKGHHFPEVEFVGVLAADDGLTLPDFRADERAFQLLAQVAGRTGRTRPGLVIYQTYQPMHPIIQAAAAHDYATFAARELTARAALGYPPQQRLARMMISGRRHGAVEETAHRLAEGLRDGLRDARREVLGPAPGVFPRLQDRYRWQLLIKGNLTAAEKSWLAACARAEAGRKQGVEVVVDVDPLGLY